MDTTLPESITLYNWSDYMSPQCLKDFEKEYGVKVKETFYDGNEALYAKLNAGATGYDVILPTDMWVTILCEERPHPAARHGARSRTSSTSPTPLFQKPPFDNPDEQDGKKYSVPYMFGTTGYAATPTRSRRRMTAGTSSGTSSTRARSRCSTRRARRSASG